MKVYFSLFIFSLFILTACTDYESMIVDDHEEWLAERAKSYSVVKTVSSSSSSPKSSSSSSNRYSDSVYDFRDGKVYNIVKIGSQTWMAENLKFVTLKSYCYNNQTDNCNKYGRLYTWAAAMDSVGSWRGICPSGWHLPTMAEFDTLISSAGGQTKAFLRLKSTTGWKGPNGDGTDIYAFNALPAGYRDEQAFYYKESYSAYFWSSTEESAYKAKYFFLGNYAGDLKVDNQRKDYAFSVRCVKDEEKIDTVPTSSTAIQSSSSLSKTSSSSLLKLSSSSLSKISSSSVIVYDSTKFKVGSFIDSRDGRTYKTIKIGSQNWMAENLNYTTTNSVCFNKDASNCTKYGRLYTWAAANGANVCPNGWRLPSSTEWEILLAKIDSLFASGRSLLTVLSAGGMYDNGNFFGEGMGSGFWTSSLIDETNAYYMNFFDGEDNAYVDNINKKYGLSVRCIENVVEAKSSSSSAVKSSSSSKVVESSCSNKVESSSNSKTSSSSQTVKSSSSSKVVESSSSNNVESSSSPKSSSSSKITESSSSNKVELSSTVESSSSSKVAESSNSNNAKMSSSVESSSSKESKATEEQSSSSLF